MLRRCAVAADYSSWRMQTGSLAHRGLHGFKRKVEECIQTGSGHIENVWPGGNAILMITGTRRLAPFPKEVFSFDSPL